MGAPTPASGRCTAAAPPPCAAPTSPPTLLFSISPLSFFLNKIGPRPESMCLHQLASSHRKPRLPPLPCRRGLRPLSWQLPLLLHLLQFPQLTTSFLMVTPLDSLPLFPPSVAEQPDAMPSPLMTSPWLLSALLLASLSPPGCRQWLPQTASREGGR